VYSSNVCATVPAPRVEQHQDANVQFIPHGSSLCSLACVQFVGVRFERLLCVLSTDPFVDNTCMSKQTWSNEVQKESQTDTFRGSDTQQDSPRASAHDRMLRMPGSRRLRARLTKPQTNGQVRRTAGACARHKTAALHVHGHTYMCMVFHMHTTIECFSKTKMLSISSTQ